MPKTLTVELVTPEKVALSQSADFVALPAFEGEMGVMPGHEPFLVQLGSGEVRVRLGRETSSFAVSGGFAEILKDKVSVFAPGSSGVTRFRWFSSRYQASIGPPPCSRLNAILYKNVEK